MREKADFWKGRPKRRSRKIARDLRALAPGIAILFCLGSAAAVIAAAESVPNEFIPSTEIQFEAAARLATLDHETSRETENRSRADRAELDPRRGDCLRSGLVDDLDEFDHEDQG